MLTIEELESSPARARSTRSCACSPTCRAGSWASACCPTSSWRRSSGEEGLHACLYLLAIDMEMEPLPGYAVRELGDGLRRLPHGAGHVDAPDGARGSRRPRWSSATSPTRRRGEPVERRAAADPEGPDRERRRDGLHGEDRVGARVLPVQGLVRRHGRRRATATCGRAPTYIMDYHMLQTTKDEWFIRQVRNGMRGAGIPVEFSQGRVRQGPARDQHHLLRRAVQRRPPRALQARREGDRAR